MNQAAERIIFADDGDGSVTAIIQIMYEGPAEQFSWLLPISTVPQEGDIGVASNLAFQRLQAATNPQYSLTTRVEGECRAERGSAAGAGGTAAPSAGAAGTGGTADDGVTVEASGVVGAFEWTVISFDQSLPDAADVAIEWLQDNGYDVAEGARGLIRPYLQDGLNLLALRLTKGADTGSIRPIRLTYPADRPMIPIKLTAVAANDDMGVMTWLLSNARGVPQNYLALELNEARINWFNASSNYTDVVSAAADEAGGQGFVTEYADEAATLSERVWSSADAWTWQTFQTGRYESFKQLFDESFWRWGTWDGYWDAVRAAVTLPEDVPFEDFKTCPDCYSSDVQFSPTAYLQALETHVIDPVRDVQTLLDTYGYVTRLYTTMSAAEMTVDPLFTFNPDLPDVSNVHTADRVIECGSGLTRAQAPWRIELPQGGVIRGTASQVGSWPTDTEAQPSSFRIMRLSDSGMGAVLEDNEEAIAGMLDAYNETVPRDGTSAPDTAGSGGGAAGTPASGTAGSGAAGSGPGSVEGPEGDHVMAGGGGCTVTGSSRTHAWTAALLAAAVLTLRIRRRKLRAPHA